MSSSRVGIVLGGIFFFPLSDASCFHQWFVDVVFVLLFFCFPPLCFLGRGYGLGLGLCSVLGLGLGLGFYRSPGHPSRHGTVIALVLGLGRFLGPGLASVFGCGLGFGFVFVCAAGLGPGRGLGPGLSLGLGAGFCCFSILELGHGPVFLPGCVDVSRSSSLSLGRLLLCSIPPPSVAIFLPLLSLASLVLSQ